MSDQADRIIEEHRSIRDKLSKLESATRSQEVIELLDGLGPLMKEHFAAEEAPETGFYAIVGEAGPQYRRSIDTLLEEHRALETQVAQLREALGQREGDHPLGELDKEVKAFVERLRQHEANETELLSVAVNDDMAAAD